MTISAAGRAEAEMNSGKRITTSLAALAAALCLCAARASAMPVYAEDDRKDLWETADRRILAMADSTVALIPAWQTAPGRGRMLLNTGTFGAKMGLCDGERFAEQSAAAECSGVLVGPDLVLTAAHCVASPITCRQYHFVFGYSVTKEGGKGPAGIPDTEVYECRELLGAVYHGENLTDWSVVRLDRPVAGHRPQELERGPVQLNEPVLAIGHPSGLPAKLADNAKVVDNTANEYFKTDLDSFAGNSGSPVFSARTGRIVGVLSRGDRDFDTVKMPDGTECMKTRRCFFGDCEGEDVTRVSEFGHLIPELGKGE